MSADPATQRSTLTITLHHLEARDVRNTDTTRPSWFELQTRGGCVHRFVVEPLATVKLTELAFYPRASDLPITLRLGYGLALE